MGFITSVTFIRPYFLGKWALLGGLPDLPGSPVDQTSRMDFRMIGMGRKDSRSYLPCSSSFGGLGLFWALIFNIPLNHEAIYNDLSRGHPKWWFSKGIPPKMALN